MPDLSPRVALGLLAAVLAAGTPSRADDPASVRWRTDYNAARKEAQAKGLPLVVEIGTAECTHCRRQDATTFRDPGVVALLNARFVPLRIDGNQNNALVQALRIQVYPTTVFAAADGKILAFLQGYVSADQLRDTARGVAPAGDGSPRPFRPREVIAAAREDFRAKRYADCLDKCEQIAGRFADLSEGKEAASLADEIKGDPDRLAAASEQFDERGAVRYLALADAWEKKGRPREAEGCLEKVLRLTPTGKTADQAQARLANLRRSEAVTVPAEVEKK
jgi:thioredoxin-like negative regulator of GroEL